MRGLPILDAPGAPELLLSLAGQDGGAASGWAFLAYLDVWLIGGLGLLAVAAVAVKWLWNRWHRGDDGDDDSGGIYYDDGYYYDADDDDDDYGRR